MSTAAVFKQFFASLVCGLTKEEGERFNYVFMLENT